MGNEQAPLSPLSDSVLPSHCLTHGDIEGSRMMYNLRVFAQTFSHLFHFSLWRGSEPSAILIPEWNGDERDREMTLIGLVRKVWMDGERE